MTNRLKSFDALKFLAIFLVIWGHSIKGFLSTPPSEDLIYRCIYSFHMPLFMMISGYFADSSMSMKQKAFLKKKFRQLIYPCLIFGGCSWFFLEVKYSFHWRHTELSILGLMEDFYWLADFWFLKSCFICFCLAYFSKRWCKSYWIPVSLLASQAITTMSVSFMYPCFVIGIGLKERAQLWERITSNNTYLFILFCLLLFFWSKETWYYSHGIPQGFIITDCSALLKIGFFRLFRMIIGIIGSLFFISFFYNLYKKDKHNLYINNLCCDWGKYTLEVYILQTILLERILCKYICLDHMTYWLFCYLVPIFSLIFVIFCVYSTKTINKSKLLRKILFGK